jgi:murein DD-endopeptidase MepM/ murein hydrolase activator NlpD
LDRADSDPPSIVLQRSLKSNSRLKLRREICLAALIATGCARPRADISPRPVPGPSVAPEDVEYFGQHPLMVPVEGVEPSRVPDTFNAPRAGGRIHAATDILAPRGTPVLAAIQGEVLRIRQNPAGGTVAYLVDDARRYVYYYAHLDRYADQLTEGLRVTQGFVIGYVGTSGNAPPDTPHLHFQAMRLRVGQTDWWNGIPIDVRPFMKWKGKSGT